MTPNRRVGRTTQELEAELAAIKSVGRAVNASLSVGDITAAALAEILDALRADLVVLFLRDGDRLTFAGAAPAARRERLDDICEHRVGECLCGVAARERTAVFSRDLLTDPRFLCEDCTRAGFVSCAAIPLDHGGDVIGVIGLSSATARDFEEQRQFLETVAGLVTGALVNARLYEISQRELVERAKTEQALRESEERSRILADAAFEGIAITAEGVLLDCSEQMAVMLGSPRPELLGRPVSAFIAPEHRDLVAAAQREGRLTPYEHLMVRATGAVFPVEVRARTISIAGRQLRITAIRDLTERKQAENTLRLFQYSIDQASDAVFWMNRDGGFSYVNEQACRSLGYSRGEFQHLRLWDIAPSFPESLWFERWEGYQADRRGGAQHFESSQRRKDGTEFPVEVVSKHLWLGDVELHVAFVRDITERRRAEQALRASEERLRLAITAANQGLFDLNVRTGESIVTAEYATMLGYDPAEFRESEAGWIERMHPDDLEEAVARYRDCLGGRLPEYRVEFRQRAKSGDWKWILSLGRVVEYDDDGQPLRMLGTHTDITDRKHAEAAMRESESLLRRSQAVAHLGSYYLDARTGQWVCSAALNDVFDIRDDYVKDVAGWIALVHPDEKDEMLRYLSEHVLEGRHRFDREYRIVRHRDGQERWVHGLGELELDEAGNPTKMIGTIQDITDRRLAEDALRASLDEKVVLLKEVHHRVKNNLQIISSLLNLQSARTQNAEVHDLLRDTQGRIRAMALLHETLYGSNTLARVNVRDYVQTISAQVVRSFLSDSRDIRLLQDVADVMLPLDQAIPAGLILNELLSNAFKHAFVDRAVGEIVVHLRLADTHHCVLRVADNGVGLQAGAGAAGSIGLLLVESLVRQLEGELSVSRERGTAFQIVFPLSPA